MVVMPAGRKPWCATSLGNPSAVDLQLSVQWHMWRPACASTASQINSKDSAFVLFNYMRHEGAGGAAEGGVQQRTVHQASLLPIYTVAMTACALLRCVLCTNHVVKYGEFCIHMCVYRLSRLPVTRTPHRNYQQPAISRSGTSTASRHIARRLW
jgi:hypothetical protein